MYKTPIFAKTRMQRNTSVQGETIEQKIERIISNKEPIKDGAPLIYTERKQGVKAKAKIKELTQAKVKQQVLEVLEM